MIVFRVEHKNDRLGPYQRDAAFIDKSANERHPHASFELPLTGSFAYYRWRFGFITLEQAKRWFDWMERASLHKQGFILAEYDVKDEYVKFDNTQAAFVPEWALHKQDRPLDRALELV